MGWIVKPWLAVVRYKSRIGDVDDSGMGISVEYGIDDPGELDLIIRQGPGWAALLWVHLRRSDEVEFPAIDYEDLQVHENVSVLDAFL